MAADVGYGISSVQAPHVGVLAQEFVHAAALALPFLVIPGTADRGNMLEPGDFACKLLQLLGITELPRTAGTVQKIEFVFSDGLAVFPVFVKRADIADEGCDSGHRRNQ